MDQRRAQRRRERAMCKATRACNRLCGAARAVCNDQHHELCRKTLQHLPPSPPLDVHSSHAHIFLSSLRTRILLQHGTSKSAPSTIAVIRRMVASLRSFGLFELLLIFIQALCTLAIASFRTHALYVINDAHSDMKDMKLTNSHLLRHTWPHLDEPKSARNNAQCD